MQLQMVNFGTNIVKLPRTFVKVFNKLTNYFYRKATVTLYGTIPQIQIHNSMLYRGCYRLISLILYLNTAKEKLFQLVGIFLYGSDNSMRYKIKY